MVEPIIPPAIIDDRIVRIIASKLAHDPNLEGYFVPYQFTKHIQFFYDVEARHGDIIYFYRPDVDDKSIGDTITWRGTTYYVVYNNYYSIGTADPYFKYALLSQYTPPGVPYLYALSWGPLWSGTLMFNIATPEYRYMHGFEVWRSFDMTNWHFLRYIRTENNLFVDEDLPPLENLWYKARAVDIYGRKSNYSRMAWFQTEWIRHGKILSVGSGGSWNDYVVANPCLLFDQDEYHLFFYGDDGTFASGNVGIGHATNSKANWDSENFTFTENPSNPIISSSGTGFMKDGASDPYVTRIGGEIVMHFTGYDNHNGTWYDGAGIGWAWAPACSGPWTFDDTTPIIPLGASGTYDDYAVWSPFLMFENGVFYNWYVGQPDANTARICRASNTESPYTAFTKYDGNPVLSEQGTGWEADQIRKLRFGVAGTFLFGYYTGQEATIGQNIGSTWSGGPTDTIYRTALNPDFRHLDGDELGVGDFFIFRQPQTHKWFAVYTAVDGLLGATSKGEIYLARLWR